MSQGNRGEIGPVRPQAHGLNDVGGVRGQLRSRESDKPGRACRAGSGFEVDAVFRDAFDRGTGLSVIERTNKATVAPCAKNLENKFGAAAAGKVQLRPEARSTRANSLGRERTTSCQAAYSIVR